MEQTTTKMNEILYGDNKFANALTTFEQKTGLKREYLLYAVLSIPVLVFALILGGDLVILALAFIYPGLKTAEAVERNDGSEMTRWLAYWVVICVSFCCGWFIDAFLFWLPALFWLKIAYIAWLLAPPPYSGTLMIYEGVIGPKVRQVLPQLKNQVDNIINTGRSFTSPRGGSGGESQDHHGTGPQGAMSQGGSRQPGSQGGPQGSMSQGGPQGSMSQGGPQGSMSQGGPQGSMSQGGPQGSMSQGSQQHQSQQGSRAPGSQMPRSQAPPSMQQGSHQPDYDEQQPKKASTKSGSQAPGSMAPGTQASQSMQPGTRMGSQATGSSQPTQQRGSSQAPRGSADEDKDSTPQSEDSQK